MTDILIRGISMPKNEPLRITLYPNGQALVDRGVYYDEFEAVELPPHGDLIDRDDLLLPAPIEDEYKRVHEIVRNAPVVIPADGGEKNEHN